MGIAELVKSPVAAGAFGLAGAGAIGIGGWQYLTSGEEETAKSLALDDLFKSGGKDCATVLFGLTPGSFVKETDSSKESSFIQPASPTSDTSSNVLGCMSYRNLEIKLAFKNDNIGWFLRTQLSSGSTTSLIHNLFLLEKPTSEKTQTWSIKTGFEWTDSQIQTLTSSEQVSLKIPWKENPKSITFGANSPSESKLVGVWKSETDTTKKGILEEVSLKKGSTSSDVFEKTGEEAFTNIMNAQKVYDATSNKWKSFDTTVSNKDIKATLNAWYKPFKDVKGSWVDANSYCADKTTAADAKISGLCVQAASNGN